MRWALTGMAVLAAGGWAAADEVVLKNGFTLEGIVTETEDRVVVEVASGSVTIPKSQVKEVVRNTEAVREFDERRRSVSTAEDHYRLGQWAAERGMKDRAEAQYRRVIALDPGHKGARQQLGYIEHEGRWVREDDFMALKGFVRHEGRWVPWDVYENLRKTELENRLQQERQVMLGSLLEDEERARPRPDGGGEERFERAGSPRRTAPWNWGVRGVR